MRFHHGEWLRHFLANWQKIYTVQRTPSRVKRIQRSSERKRQQSSAIIVHTQENERRENCCCRRFWNVSNM